MRGLRRLNGAARLGGVDLARGLAVIGMFAAHLVTVDRFDAAEPSTWADIANGRSSILFATLAGVSIGLITGGRRPLRGARLRTAMGRILVRAGLLWVLGVALVATRVPIAVILPAYALLFVLALPFLLAPARILLPVALGLGLVTPLLYARIEAVAQPGPELDAMLGWHYPFVVWIAFVLAGLALARADLTRFRVQGAALIGGALVSALGYGLSGLAAPIPALASAWTADAHSSGILEVLGSGGFAIAAIGLCLLVCRSVVATIALPLRAVGSMPLTAYTVQVLVWWAVAAWIVGAVTDLFGVRELGLFWYLTIGVTVLCTLWALLVGRGPIETLFDRVARALIPAPASRSFRERVDA